jgi:hypothetical protein
MSRASWYRHGKPTEKPRKVMTVAERAQMVGAPSTRTHQRIERVMQVPELALMMEHGWKPAQCERVLNDPPLLRKFLGEYRRLVEEAKSTDGKAKAGDKG